jgi:hypothetical protein
MPVSSIVTALTGRAWVCHGEGSRAPLRLGGKIAPGACIETGAGSSVQLQSEGSGERILLGGERRVVYAGEMPEVNIDENAVRPASAARARRLLAAWINEAGDFPDQTPAAGPGGRR